MLITYTDISAETRTVDLSLSDLDTGTAQFMEWFKQQSQTEMTYVDTIGSHFIRTTSATKNFSEFDFSGADILDPYGDYAELQNSVVIFPPFENESQHHINNYINMNDDDFTTNFVSNIKPATTIHPSLLIFKTLYEDKTNYLQKYNLLKETLGVDKFNDPRYNISVVRIGRLDIPAGQAIESIQSITF